jgi:hypothetical protein
MKKKMKPTFALVFAVAFVCAVVMLTGVQAQAETLKTRIGKLEFTHDWKNGYPTDDTVTKLYDELDFQRATQTYIWAIPFVSQAQMRHMYVDIFKASTGSIVILDTFDRRHGYLTANNDTFYSTAWADMGADGPVVVELPEGINARGAAHDMWWMEIAAMTKPGKYLFVPPGTDVPKDSDGFTVLKAPHNNFFIALRLFDKNDAAKLTTTKKIKIYPFSERNNAPAIRIVYADKPHFSAQPRGMDYWKALAAAIDREPVAERDRFFMAYLASLGIEKGKPFNPNERQIRILTEGAKIGEMMTKAIQGARRMPQAVYRKGSHWEIATTANPNQRTEYYDQIDGRAAWLYEALLNNEAMRSTKPGKTQVYLAAYKDKDGDWLDGGKNYVLNVPANPPAETFWSATIYDVNMRTLIKTDQKKPTVGSIQGFDKNPDGSVTIYVGPDAPKGKERNWIKTIPGQGWFSYFRLYSPTEPFFDGRWVLPDFEKAE